MTDRCFKIYNKINSKKKIEWRFNKYGCKYPGKT